jgi:tripartite-type tricarboxylate transporter receptor subunit TctC
MFRRHLLGAAALLATPAIRPAGAQAPWPNQPIRLVVPFAAGGPTDIPARLFAERIGEALPQRVIVENRTGAGVVVGTDLVAKAPKDGHTLLYTTVAHASLRQLFPRLPFDPAADLVPVALAGVIPMVVTVNKDYPARTLAELRDRIRATRGGIDYASSGNGGALHLSTELLLRRMGVSANHVPYRGTAAAMPDVLNGTIPLIVDVATSAVPYVQRGETRGLAVMDARRLPQLPEVPTTAEAGLPGLRFGTWFGLVAPPGTPAAVAERLSGAVDEALRDPEIGGRLAEQGAVPGGGTPDAFGRFMEAERAKLEPVVRGSGMRAD